MQEAHEKIRVLSIEVAKEMKVEGLRVNNLIEKIRSDPYFKDILSELPSILDKRTFIGCADLQVNARLGFLLFLPYMIFFCIANVRNNVFHPFF